MSTIATTKNILDAARSEVWDLFANQVPEAKYTYHSFDHTMRVFDSAQEIASLAGLSFQKREILGLAALFHDVGFAKTYDGHEDASKQMAKAFLEERDYPSEDIQTVLDCIQVTLFSQPPENQMQAIMKDADMSSLGKRIYFDQAEKLRVERNRVLGENISENDWLKTNIAFLTDHRYHSPEARILYDDRKSKNLDKLKRLASPNGSSKVKKTSTIGSSKSAQTQFKTSLRNHIDLSSIADNKANIMLSVNALIITIALPVLGNSISENPNMLFPTIVLLVVCVVSIVFATLATRPIKMAGKTSMESILNKKSNLFFFGNFHKMTFNEYEEGIGEVVGNDEILDSSIMRDLFYLGKALGNKYRYLRLCYNFFMYGIIVTVIAFTVGIAI